MSEYIVWCPGYGEEKEDGKMFEASHGHAAAEKWAKCMDTDCDIVEEREIPTVFVQKEGGVKVYKFIVNGWTERRYSARLIVGAADEIARNTEGE